jgi:alanine-synthesizing transaminase
MRFAKRTNWDLELNPWAKAVAEHRAAGKPLIDLTVSNPTECGFTYDTETILGALRSAEAMKYEPHPQGLEVARRAVASYYADREGQGYDVSIEDIFMTTSTSEAYSWLLRLLCDVGDEVLVPSPGYPLLDFLADLNDVNLVRYPLVYSVSEGEAVDNHGWHYDFRALEQAISPRTRAVVVVHPNNPTGNYCKPQERERLNQICVERGLALIADEVFLDFALDGVPRPSFVTNTRQAGEPLKFTLSGISKICGLPQMKVAWVVVGGPEGAKREACGRLDIIADTYLSPNAPLQWALPALLGTRRGFQEQLITRIGSNLEQLERAMRDHVERLELEGGWNAIARVRGAEARRNSAEELLAPRGVVVQPGSFYGLATKGQWVFSLLTEPRFFVAGMSKLA